MRSPGCSTPCQRCTATTGKLVAPVNSHRAVLQPCWTRGFAALKQQTWSHNGLDHSAIYSIWCGKYDFVSDQARRAENMQVAQLKTCFSCATCFNWKTKATRLEQYSCYRSGSSSATLPRTPVRKSFRILCAPFSASPWNSLSPTCLTKSSPV